MGRLMGELNAAVPEDGILVADGGFAAHWAACSTTRRRAGRGFVPDRGFASIGYGLPGAIGAALAAPERPVVALTGDGGFNMMLGELETARRLGVAICDRHREQRRLRLREGAAASDVRRRRLSRLRPRSRRTMPRSPAPSAAAASASSTRTRSARRCGAGSPRGTDRDRRRGDARPRADAARRRQPHRRGARGRPGGLRSGAR